MGVSGVASFITTDEQLQLNRGCCFLVQAMLSEGFAFYQFNNSKSTACLKTLETKKDLYLEPFDSQLKKMVILRTSTVLI